MSIRKLSVLGAIFILFSASATLAQIPHILTEEDVVFEDGVITDYLSEYTDIIIPPYLDGQIVKEIGGNAFYYSRLGRGRAPISSLKLPETIKKIGANAFIGNELTEVNIPNSVVIIGSRAFSNNNLSGFYLPSPEHAGQWNSGSSGEMVSNFIIEYLYVNETTYQAGDDDFIIEDGVITAYLGPHGKIQIPSVIQGQNITAIGERAFENRMLADVALPEGITHIGPYAFSRNYLTNIELPESVVEIGEYAFQQNQLEQVIIPSGVSDISDHSFYNNKLTAVSLPDGITRIGVSAFRVNQLDNLVLPETVTEIAESAFHGNQLAALTIPEGVTVLGRYAFAGNKLASIIIPEGLLQPGEYAFSSNELTNVSLPEGMEVIGDGLFRQNKLSSVDIPSTVTEIGGSAFEYNELTDVEIPPVVTKIGIYAFRYNQLEELHIPNKVVEILYSAFSNNSLTSFVLPTPAESGTWNTGISGEEVTALNQTYIYAYDNYTVSEEDFSVEDGVITGYTGPTGIDLVIPSTIGGEPVTAIGRFAFYNKALTAVTIPNSVTNLGQWAFSNNNLTSVTIPGSVTVMESRAFSDNNLTSVTIQNGLEKLDFWVFSDNQLTTVNLPNSVTYISVRAFYDNPNLTNFKLPSPAVPGEWNEGTAGQTVTYQDMTYAYLYDDYQAEDSDFLVEDGEIKAYYGPGGNVTIPDVIDGQTITAIGEEAFYDKMLTGVAIPATVTNIGVRAFNYNQLTQVDLPDELTTIGDGAFQSNSLSEISLPEGVTEIGNNAFYDNALTSLTLPSGVIEIGSGSFSFNQINSLSLPATLVKIGTSAFRYNKLTEVTIPDGLLRIENYAFDYNELTSINWGSAVAELGNHAFANNKLENLALPSTIEKIGDYTFYRNELSDLELPESLTTIGNGAFRENQLSEVMIPESVQAIGEYAFNKNQLEQLVLSDAVISVGNYAFADNALESITLPSSLTSIPTGAFRTNNLVEVTIPEGVRIIEPNAFSQNSLTTVGLPSSLEKIDYGAFLINQLENVSLPSSLWYLGSNAFGNNLLTSIILPIKEETGEWDKGTAGEPTTELNQVHQYNFTAYQAQDADFLFEDGEILDYYGPGGGLVIPEMINGETVTSIGSNAFQNNLLTGVQFPATVTQIGRYAFSNNQLTEVALPNSLINIDAYAFQYNELTSFVLPTPEFREYELEGWKASSNEMYDMGAATEDLASSYQIRIGEDKTALIGVLIDGEEADLSVTGDISQSYTSIKSASFLAVKGDNIVITPENLNFPAGYGLSPQVYELEDIQESQSLVFSYGLLSYDINYVAEESSHGNPSSYTIEDEIVLNDAIKEGYSFEGWYEEESFENEVTNIVDHTGMLVLYAKFTPIEYNITYETAGGDHGNPATYTIEDEVLLSAARRDGYAFEGWYAEDTYENKIESVMGTGAATLYAKFSAESYTITYETEGGSHENPATYTIENEVILNTASKEGYTFDGWYSDKTFTQPVANIPPGSTGTQIFYAKFTANTYSIRYETDGGTHQNPTSYTIKDDEIMLVAATKEGVEFDGWYYEPTFENEVTSIAPGSVGDITLYARWSVVAGLEEKLTSVVMVYPNPSNGTFRVRGEDIPFVTVFNSAGQAVYEYNGLGMNEIQLRLNEPPGVYYLSTMSNGNPLRIKLVIR